MHRPDQQPAFAYRVAAMLVLAHLLVIVALAASPRLHAWVHPDCDDGDEHECSVTLFVHGGCDQSPSPLSLAACIEVTAVLLCVEGPQDWVAGIFAVNCTLEHAPPRLSVACNLFRVRFA